MSDRLIAEALWDELRREIRSQFLTWTYGRALARGLKFGKIEIDIANGQIKTIRVSPSIAAEEHG